MPFDLNNLTTPMARVTDVEIFDPTNAWSGAPSRIYVDVNRMAGGLYQTGYDPATGRMWVRVKRFDTGAWSAWKAADGGTVTDPPVPLYAKQSGTHVVEVNFSLMLDPASVPATTAFAIKVNAATQTLASVKVNGATCSVAANSALPAGTVTISYTVPGSNMLKSVDGINVATFTDFAVTA